VITICDNINELNFQKLEALGINESKKGEIWRQRNTHGQMRRYIILHVENVRIGGVMQVILGIGNLL
jgi:hypothetical protein